ncbi:family 16 glycosylhydrolase [Kiritimatiellota bacterium B12222]|nr:family 16 glycosylhydrolase [Kiritimatiellota bacterium B12222]
MTFPPQIIHNVFAISLTLLTIATQYPALAEQVDGYHEFNYGQNKKDSNNWIQAIRVSQPAPRSEVNGQVTVKFQAPGMDEVRAYCWKAPGEDDSNHPWGSDTLLTPKGMTLDAKDQGSFTFDAGAFPHGPMNVRIFASNKAGKKDIFELQLFNIGGVVWNQGIPDTPPPAAKGLKLIFEDDFDGELSISNDGRGTTYQSHKPGGGDFSGWQFSNVLGDGKPFAQQGTWLKIAARKDKQSPKGRSGILASVDADYKGIWAKAPFYMECRFTAQSAIGTWPAFWTLALRGEETDELDIVEAYGGMGKGNPNHPGYSIVSHFWKQKKTDGTPKKGVSTRVDIMDLGGKNYWSTTFHTYAVYVGLEDTVYYFDDIEVLRHPSGEVSKSVPHFFLINLAIGGISRWPIDLERYGNGSDMWVDYVRVYAKEAVDPEYNIASTIEPARKFGSVGLNLAVENQDRTFIAAHYAAGAENVSQRNWNNLKGPKGTQLDIVDAAGKQIPGLQTQWKVTGVNQEGNSQLARDWGFKHGDLALQLGHIKSGGALKISGIPYPRYDIYVYLGAGSSAGQGKVMLSSPTPQLIDPQHSYFYKISWLQGKFKVATATKFAQAHPSNMVVFKNNSAETVAIEWVGNLQGGATGVTAIQIVDRQTDGK